MRGETEGITASLERFRDYLRLIARLEVDARFQGKVDFSGVVQQTILEAHQGWTRYRGTSDLELTAWLRKILAHNLIDEIRRLGAQMRDIERECSLEAALEESSTRIEKWLVAEDSSPSDRVSREEQLSRVAAVLADIPEDQRTAVELHHLRGLSLASAAEVMGKSRSAVASLIFRGLQKMRRTLEGHEG